MSEKTSNMSLSSEANNPLRKEAGLSELDQKRENDMEISPQGADNEATDSEAPAQDKDASVPSATGDLEALHRTPSGPVYSVFSERQRQFIVAMVACGGFFSPLSANIYFPALTALSADLRVSNELINLSLTSYMIFQGLAPTIFGDLADMTGRRPTYILGFIIYIGANVGLALQNNYAALLVLRCLQSTGSSGTVALGNGVVADISSSGERGKFMGISVDPHRGQCTELRQVSLNLVQWQLPQSLQLWEAF